MKMVIIFFIVIFSWLPFLSGVGRLTKMEGGRVKGSDHFVLVHGAMHGAWCWYKIRALLESAGHRVSCLDLKGAGIDRSDPDAIVKFAEYSEPLIKFMSSLPHDEKVILVGHSLGGFSVTYAIQEFGHKIHLAIYICGAMLPNTFIANGTVSKMLEYGYGLGPDKPPTSVIVKKEFQREILYNTSPLEDSTLASMLLRPCPIRPGKDANFSVGRDTEVKVKRVFIKTMKDQNVRPEVQDQLIQMWPPSLVLTIETDHSPFFSAPGHLTHLMFQAMAHK